MSIINEALKKAQNNLSKQEKPNLNTDKIDKSAVESTISNIIKTTHLERSSPTTNKIKKANIRLICIFFLIIAASLAILLILMKKTALQDPQLNKTKIVQPVLSQQTTEQQTSSIKNSNTSLKKNFAPLIKPIETASKYQEQFILSGITFIVDKKMAIVNNDVYEENEFVEGYKIKKIEKKIVTLISPEGKELILSVKKQQ